MTTEDTTTRLYAALLQGRPLHELTDEHLGLFARAAVAAEKALVTAMLADDGQPRATS